MRADATTVPLRLDRGARVTRSLTQRRLVVVAAGSCTVMLFVGQAFAGSPDRLAGGVRVAGVDVGGLDAQAARVLLETRAARLSRVPVRFVAGRRTWDLSPVQLGVASDWAAAVETARARGDGIGPLRGLRRLALRLRGADVAAPARVYDAALVFALDSIARDVRRAPRDAALRLRGLEPIVVPAQAGRSLDRVGGEATVVRALTGFTRAPVALPLRIDRPRVHAAALAPVARRARIALSAPVRLRLGETRWRLPRWRIAQLLALPRDGSTSLALSGPAADLWFAGLAKRVERTPVDAQFAVGSDGRVRVVPGRDGVRLDVRRSADAILTAALSRTDRAATLAVTQAPPARTTAEAKAMGITGLVGGYTTTYGGEPNRLHNVRLVAQLIDGALVAPGATFSFNQTTGERTAEKGFLEAPVIINGELQTGLGGGVCQVSTTVFNAAYEAGLKIDARTNHALYIDHYPLGRDATVNYPDLDLRFTNDTEEWLLVRTFVGSSSLTVNLYGTPAERRVVTQASPLIAGTGPIERQVPDPTLPVGERRVEEEGQPSRSTSVRRLVYGGDGQLLHDDSWSSYYRAEERVVRVGTKEPPAPVPADGAKEAKDQAEAGPAKADEGAKKAAPAAPKPSPPADAADVIRSGPLQP